MTIEITRDTLARMFPRARADWINAFIGIGPVLAAHYQFDRLRWVHFCGQISAETNGLTLNPLAENMNYTSAARILEIFNYRLGLCIKKPQAVFGRYYKSRAALAQDLVRQPTMLANIVYGGREGTPWMEGARYIGRGPLQCTHRNNYINVGEEIAKQPGGAVYDLSRTPELLATNAELGVRAAFAEWQIDGFNRYADSDDVETLSDALNTGNTKDSVKPHNLAGRRRETARAKAVWPVDRAVGDVYERPNMDGAPVRVLRRGMRGPDVVALQERLHVLGHPVGAVDGIFGKLTEESVIAVQHAHGLVVDGVVGPRTFDILNTTEPEPIETREETTKEELKEKGSTTMAQAAVIKRGSEATAFMELIEAGSEISAKLSQARSLSEALFDFTSWLTTPGGLKSAITLAVCFALWRSANAIEWSRLWDHITGRNRGR